jgi:nitrite reductase (NO-forming)
MSHSDQEPIYRTSPARFGKLIAILVGIMIVGGVIFFVNYDYWNSYLPTAGKIQEGLGSHAPSVTGTPSATGQTVEVNLSFMESPDFKVYAFNALSGSDKNPDIHAHVGDKILIHVKNTGKSFHAFGITDSKEGPGPIIDGTAVGTADNPLKPGKGGDVTFVAPAAGEYYYICTVPGHRELGMEGKIEILPAAGGSQAPSGGEVKATGNKVEFTVNFIMSDDFKQYAFNALPGQPGSNSDIQVKSGDTVTIHVKNPTKSFHAFGIVADPSNPSDVLWNSAVASPDNPLKPGKSGDVTFVAGAPGTYHYICTVPGHAELGMDAKFIVQ